MEVTKQLDMNDTEYCEKGWNGGHYHWFFFNETLGISPVSILVCEII